jgi:hypothetical protein
VEALMELNESEGVLVTEAAGDWDRRRSPPPIVVVVVVVESTSVSRRGKVGFVSCVNEGGNPREGMD